MQREKESRSAALKRAGAFLKEHAAAALTAAAVALIAAAWLFERAGAMPAAVPLYILGFISGGYISARDGLATLIKERDLDVDLLMVVAAIGAASIGYWVDGAVLIIIFALSGTLEGYAFRRTGRDVAALMKARPETATLLKDGREEQVAVETLLPGDVVLIKAGERLPADGVVVEGYSAVDESAITGESIPAEKAPGSAVYAGSINGQGSLKVQVTEAAEASLIARLVQLVQQAQHEKPPTQQFLERFERRYARWVIAGAALAAALPPLLLGWSWNAALYRAMIFLVVASPCALVASMMPAVLSSVSNGARNGILFKGGSHVETLGGVKAIAFDKTGTITTGRPVVTDILPKEGASEKEALQTAASLERRSEHPLAKAIVAAADERGLELEEPSETEEIPGFGLRGRLAGRRWFLGRRALLQQEGVELNAAAARAVERLEAEGKTVVVLASGRGAEAVIALQDTLRPGLEKRIEELRRLGVEHIALLTGDTRRSGEAIARQAGCDEAHTELLPEDKVHIVKELAERFGSVAMVGDGVNDAPALAAASVGVAMGGAGSDAALETADVVLVADDLAKLPYAIALGRRTRRVVRQNIAFSLSVIALLMAANFLELLTLPMGVVGHEGSTILVILNGLRLLRGPGAPAARG